MFKKGDKVEVVSANGVDTRLGKVIGVTNETIDPTVVVEHRAFGSSIDEDIVQLFSNTGTSRKHGSVVKIRKPRELRRAVVNRYTNGQLDVGNWCTIDRFEELYPGALKGYLGYFEGEYLDGQYINIKFVPK